MKYKILSVIALLLGMSLSVKAGESSKIKEENQNYSMIYSAYRAIPLAASNLFYRLKRWSYRAPTETPTSLIDEWVDMENNSLEGVDLSTSTVVSTYQADKGNQPQDAPFSLNLSGTFDKSGMTGLPPQPIVTELDCKLTFFSNDQESTDLLSSSRLQEISQIEDKSKDPPELKFRDSESEGSFFHGSGNFEPPVITTVTINGPLNTYFQIEDLPTWHTFIEKYFGSLIITEAASPKHQTEIFESIILSANDLTTNKTFLGAYSKLQQEHEGKLSVEFLKAFYEPLTLSPAQALKTFFAHALEKKLTSKVGDQKVEWTRNEADLFCITYLYAFAAGIWPNQVKIDKDYSSDWLQHRFIAQNCLQGLFSKPDPQKEQLRRIYNLYLYHMKGDADN